MRMSFSKIGLAAVAVIGFGLFLPLGGAHALTISPPLIDHQLNPGDTVLETIKIYNEDPWDITVYPLLRNFTSGKNETGEPAFLPPEEEDNGTGLAKWIIMDSNPITIGPKERTNLSLALNIPVDAQPGGHYGGVLLSTEPPSNKPGVGVSQQLGALIMIRVSGEVIEDGRIAEFGFVKPKVWYNYLPIDFLLRFENSGNTHLRPAGNIFITNMFGKQVASININPEFRGVLPRSIRKFNLTWDKNPVNDQDSELKKEWKNFGLGKYKAMLVIYYGNENKLVAAEREFSVWPWRLMIIFGVSLFALIGALLLIGKFYRHRLMKRLEKMLDKKRGGVTEKELRMKMEQEMRAKLEKEYQERLAQELKGKGGGVEPEHHTDVPDELKK